MTTTWWTGFNSALRGAGPRSALRWKSDVFLVVPFSIWWRSMAATRHGELLRSGFLRRSVIRSVCLCVVCVVCVCACSGL